MKYVYPYKEWAGGMIFFLMISIWGGWFIYDIGAGWKFGIGYMAICYLLIDWYWSKFQYYRSKYIKISSDGIEFAFNNNQDIRQYQTEEIQYIFNVNHKQRLKIHNVLHIFMENGDYFYLTNEINKYERIKKELQQKIPTKYHCIEGYIHGVLEGDKKKLFLEKLDEKDKIA
ncbi:hypothetical protein [Alkaliphilus hydrothermalis]|uniref:PH domain-containing protein n=1 Tax=Alkaliphilus hydrothermalis TaxID=1482730 RepID=A0ABS2NTD3_9FIRM|nr:hypothetical protein [Alkaliphilus hydrothermalis]MBM7616229.1 hypothetical protein [Alkaliphilus hydrothermalis]